MSFRPGNQEAGYLWRLVADGAVDQAMLCRVLRRDSDPEVQIAAAGVLAQLGDEDALPALTDTLRGFFVRRSSRWQLANGLGTAAACLATVLFSLLFQWAVMPWLQETGLVALLLIGVLAALAATPFYCHRTSRRRAAMRAVTAAILQITERTRSARARQAVQHLRTTAADFLQYDEETRTQARVVAHRLDMLTRHLDKLPVPSAPPLTADVLPRPSQAPPIPVETLPRVGA